MDVKQTLFACLFFLTLVSCKRNNIGDDISRNGESFSIADRLAIGQKISEAIFDNSSAFPILDESENELAYRYLQDSVLEVIVNSPVVTHRTDFNWKVNIIDFKGKRHAFFLPNGELFIHVDLLKLLRNDAELLGIIGHELAYVEKGYVTKNLKEEFGGDVLSAIADGNSSGDLNDIALYFNRIAYDAKKVLYADSFAMAAICPFSYDPQEFKKILEHFDSDFPGNVNIDWYSRREAEYLDRENKINDFFAENAECIYGSNVKRTEEYERFRDVYLP